MQAARNQLQTSAVTAYFFAGFALLAGFAGNAAGAALAEAFPGALEAAGAAGLAAAKGAFAGLEPEEAFTAGSVCAVAGALAITTAAFFAAPFAAEVIFAAGAGDA